MSEPCFFGAVTLSRTLPLSSYLAFRSLPWRKSSPTLRSSAVIRSLYLTLRRLGNLDNPLQQAKPRQRPFTQPFNRCGSEFLVESHYLSFQQSQSLAVGIGGGEHVKFRD